ncbi:TDT family transporter [Paragemmobacter ruber]|nr:tellurium resistance protein [Rhodobacter ruber]
MPPAVFPAILGLFGLGLALRRGLAAAGLPGGVAEIVLGAVAGLWAFAILAYGAKMARRGSVLLDDLRVLPGRMGLAAASMGGMALAAALAPFAVGGARVVLVAALLAHLALAVLTIRVLLALPPEGRGVNPGWHLSFVGFILGGLAAPGVGWPVLGLALFWVCGAVAVVIWGVSAVQLARRIPPAPLRPLLAVHVAPAALLAVTGTQGGVPVLPMVALAIATGIVALLVVSARWVLEAGFSAMWAAFTFPVAAYAAALFVTGFEVAGMVVLVLVLAVVPVIAWRVVTLWGSGQLAARTHAAEA